MVLADVGVDGSGRRGPARPPEGRIEAARASAGRGIGPCGRTWAAPQRRPGGGWGVRAVFAENLGLGAGGDRPAWMILGADLGPGEAGAAAGGLDGRGSSSGAGWCCN